MNEVEALEGLRKKAVKSTQMLQLRPLEYLVRAMLAGVFIGFAIIFTLKSINGFYLNESPVTTLVGGLTFGVALVLIVYGGAELFTGNTMYFTTSTMRGYTSKMDTFKVWTLCFIGNGLGGLAFALLFSQTGIIQELGMDNWLFAVSETKIHHTTWEIFTRAIFCNWMVCLAIFIPKNMKNELAQIMMMMILVAVFFASGFDHVIANMALFSLALVVPHPEAISFAGAIHNLIPALFGNIIGGALFMGMIYTWLNKSKLEVDQSDQEAATINIASKQKA
ncbi:MULTISPECIES: formate/nitrite transporter family protein [Exiguobacterium]|uniref:Formate/nitrite transporter family protein n=1 Tax=Exiguobacterium antarcticum TaxID=132920 RepID=A0ABT6R4W2_9BACL|nr:MULTISPECIES: formate/nitrite transporter family protein [Exiguobacterium]AFS69678.1 Formate/nitrite transporter [Exiguobacterium antarcticum B7]MDI3235999.1 formate/nitrite transporter family protein [Exiguobacterium antarcticum]OIN66278.1 transporter [Exiguobacterium sp. KRL4]